MAKDYYQILGVPRKASDKEIRQAFRRLARQHHPDVSRGGKDSDGRFKEINEAYQVLSDPESREKYDRYGENWKYADRLAQEGRGGQAADEFFTWRGRGAPGGAPVDLGDLLGDFLGGEGSGRTATQRRPRRAQAEQPVELTLEEAFHGTTRVVQLSLPGAAQPRRLEMTVPPGVDTGSRVHVSTEGVDVYLVVNVLPHRQFRRQGADLYVDVEVSLVDMVLGGEVEVPTLTKRVTLKVPPETQNGRVFRLAGQGMPRLGDQKGRGNLYATLRPLLPTGLAEEEQELFQRLRELRRPEGDGG